MKKRLASMVMSILLLSFTAVAEQLFTGVIHTLDPRDSVVFIDGKMYRIAKDAVIEDPRKEDGMMAVQDLKSGQRVTFGLQTSEEGENRIVYLSISN